MLLIKSVENHGNRESPAQWKINNATTLVCVEKRKKVPYFGKYY